MLQTGRKPKNNTILRQTNQNVFPAIMMKVGYLRHTHKKKTLFLCDKKLKPALTANTQKHVFDKLVRQTHISCRETWQRLF